jgi:glucose-6-phosphate dehydrogenase assembly protein OpcA
MAIQSAPLVSLRNPTDVSLADIETELTRIWENYSLANADSGSPAAVRAATFTLIVYEPEETQQLLAQLGFYGGPIDGIDGPRTQTAIQAAQTSYKLKQTGKATPELLERLRHELAICRGEINEEGAVCSILNYSRDVAGAGVADAIAAQNPCRIIALFPTVMADEGVSAQVSVYCPIHQNSAGALMCCEYITLKGTEAALERVSGMIASLVSGDLPNYLWWKGLPNVEKLLFKQLGQDCTAVIIDSSRFVHEPEANLLAVQGLLQDEVAISDLNWRRLAPWLELTAEAFDPPERWEGLLAVDRVTIDYEKGNPTQALLFLGWLASRPNLEWEPIARHFDGGEYDIQRIMFRSKNGRTIEAELAALPTDAGEVVGDIADFRLSSTDPEADCGTILCSETKGCMRMESGGKADNCYVQQVSPLNDQKAETLLSEQISRYSRDLLFEASLAVAAKILAL